MASIKIVEGAKIYRGDDLTRHRTDGPAQIYPSGLKQWYYHGMIYRSDGPCEMGGHQGVVRWRDDYFKTYPHRIGGAAVERPNGLKIWYNSGKEIWPTL